MPTPPPLPPSWDGLHPLVVHFPIALLLVAPLFVIIAAVVGRKDFMIAALLLQVLGVVSAFVASSTGEEAYAVFEPDEASELLDPDWMYDEVAVAHGEQAEHARDFFTVVAALYAVLVGVAFWKPAVLKPLPRAVAATVFVLAMGYGALLLSSAAHKGGELVHVYGVRATLAEASVEATEE